MTLFTHLIGDYSASQSDAVHELLVGVALGVAIVAELLVGAALGVAIGCYSAITGLVQWSPSLEVFLQVVAGLLLEQ